jgi:ATP-dependent Lon protease
VKEQLKKIGGMKFYDVNFSYINNETMTEEFVSVPEQGGGKIIPEGLGKPGHIYTVGRGKSGMFGSYKIETEVVRGNGKFERTGLGTVREKKKVLIQHFDFLKLTVKILVVRSIQP